MYHDEIVEEIHRIRQEYSRSFNHDLEAIFADLQKKQAESGIKVVDLSRKPDLTKRWRRKKLMIAQAQDYQKMTPEEYLEWEAQQEFRYEYVDGEILAMTGGTIPHTKIYLNFYTALRPHLSQRGCEAYVSDVKVRDSKNNRYFYPDLVVTCNAEDLKSRDFIQHPKVIVEVLSPSTRKYDRDDKLKYYQQFSSLQEYVLVDSESISVEIYQRGEGKIWHYCRYTEGESITLESIEFTCAIEVLYEGVNLEIPEKKD
ncbi:Uma2 family endonuclease [Okeania sp. SIO3I5]|uniref:Uma2 family endonuclease n=1 Tax=Okeania sp. SIO3I5 TaxID=2607805 RepID=UPI0034380609